MITVNFTFSAAEARRAMRYMVLRSRGPSLLLAIGVGMLAIGVATGKTVWFGVAAAELLAWVALIALIPRVSLGSTGGEHTLSFSEDGVTASNAGGSQRFLWDHWRRWRRRAAGRGRRCAATPASGPRETAASPPHWRR